MDMLQKYPETLNTRLIVIERLIRLEPFLRIGMDNIPDMILLSEPRGAASSASIKLQQQSHQNMGQEKGSEKLSEIFRDKNA